MNSLIQTIYNINRALELEPDPFKRLNMVSHIKQVEQQLRDLAEHGQSYQASRTAIKGFESKGTIKDEICN